MPNKKNQAAAKPTGERDAERKRRPEPRSALVPTAQPVVEEMLRLAKVKNGELDYNLGSGHGRIVITAAKKIQLPSDWV